MPTDGSLARWRSRRGLRIAALLAGVSLSAVSAHAQDATWNLNGTGDFNTSANWTPATVPTGTAIFGVSNQNNVTFSATTSNINSWTFNAGASSYNFTINPTATGGINFFGAGIVLNGGTANIINSGTLAFNSGTAGRTTISNNAGLVVFSGSSTAGSATIINNFLPAAAQFPVQFIGSATAGNATIINNNPLTFQQNSTAGNAIINNSSQIIFFDAATGGTARLINAAAGTVDMSFLSNAGMTMGVD
jgi:hypothetical protein